ncbi:uncharacterized protein [Rutidosis leptorrhynchoides]|uniref:uncharacterized protein n=1 Tax=Rutidosis leptorrhynchoides TaxID=125765 RepID=UPI003A99D5D8
MWLPWLSISSRSKKQRKIPYSTPNSPRNFQSPLSKTWKTSAMNQNPISIPPPEIAVNYPTDSELRQGDKRCMGPVDHQHRNTKSSIVLYFTSLHIIRRTFEECRTVRAILQGYHRRVEIDERDLSIDCKFIDELHELMKSIRKNISFPAVFMGGEYIGGAEEIQGLHESGELRRMIDRLPCGRGGLAVVGSTPPATAARGVEGIIVCNGIENGELYACYEDA